MNLGISTEQRELRESVRRFLAERAPLTQGPRADGDRGRDRPRRLAAGQRSAGPAGDRRSRGVRRGRLLLRRAGHRARGARRRPVHRAVPGQRGAGRNRAAGQRRRRSQEGPAAGHRRGGDRRHAGLHRGRRILGPGLDPAGRYENGGKRLAARRAQELRPRRPRRRPHPGRRGPRDRHRNRRAAVTVRRQFCYLRPDPPSPAHPGPDQETGPAGVRRTRQPG